MSSEQNQKDFAEFLSGNSVKPPTGSVFDDLQLGGGPPMVRMIILQIAFQFLSKIQKLKNTHKAMLIGLVCCVFVARDLNAFTTTRGPNLYSALGAHRSSNVEFLKERLELAKVCDLQMDEQSCAPFAHTSKRLNAAEIQDIKFVLVDKPNLRELYDKTETFIKKKTEKTVLNPSQGSRYLSAFTELSGYSMFIIMMALYVEKHQNFAKQMTIVSLLVFATISFQLKAPLEGEEENQIVQLVKGMPSLDSFTFFELSYIVKSIIYPMVFQAALFMSRMIDIDPILQIRERLSFAQRVLSRTIVLCELITDINESSKVEQAENIDTNQEQKSEIQVEGQLAATELEGEKVDIIEAQQNVVIQSLKDFGKANQHVFQAYKWVCNMRKTDTIDYIRNRIETATKTEANVSYIGKIAKLVKKLFILAIVGILVGPTLYQAIAPQLGIDINPAAESAKVQMPRTGEDLAKAAQQREDKDQQRQRQQQQDFDNLYDSGGNNDDL